MDVGFDELGPLWHGQDGVVWGVRKEGVGDGAESGAGRFACSQVVDVQRGYALCHAYDEGVYGHEGGVSWRAAGQQWMILRVEEGFGEYGLGIVGIIHGDRAVRIHLCDCRGASTRGNV